MRNGGVPFRDVFSSQGPLFLPLVWIADTLGLHSLNGARLLGLASGLVLVLVVYLAGRELGGTDRRPHRRRAGRGDRQQHRGHRLHRRRRPGHGAGLPPPSSSLCATARDPSTDSGRRHGRGPRRRHHGQGPGPARGRAGRADPAVGPPAQGLVRRRGRRRRRRRSACPSSGASPTSGTSRCATTSTPRAGLTPGANLKKLISTLTTRDVALVATGRADPRRRPAPPERSG